MASVAKRPDGSWRARYRDDAGREHAKHFGGKTDAQRWLDEVTAAVVTGHYVDPRAGRETVRQYAERWRAVQDHRAGLPTTVHLHHLRHGYANLLNGAGVPFTTVMELLGHAPHGVTRSTYTHRVEGWDRQVRTVLDEAWRGSADHLRTERAR